MKITKELLREIIQEEIKGLLNESNWNEYSVEVNKQIREAIQKLNINGTIGNTAIENKKYQDGTLKTTLHIPVTFLHPKE